MMTASKLRVFCDNCGEYVLDADPYELKTPLKGHMFMQREDTEWAIFHESYEGNDLTCPMCDWVMHTEEVLRVEVEGTIIRGTADEIVELMDLPPKKDEADVPVEPVMVSKCRFCKKDIPQGKYCSDECLKADFEKAKKKRGYTRTGKKYTMEEAHKVPKGQGMMNQTKKVLENLLDG